MKIHRDVSPRGNPYKHSLWKIRHSFGVVVYAKSTRQFLIIQNRDSHPFLFFFMMRNIEQWTTDQMMELLAGCTQDELQRLLYYPFQDVYYDLYLNHDRARYHQQETLAHHNYRYFHSHPTWKERVQTLTGRILSWEFPKGRLSDPNEVPIRCAFRELEEETGMKLVPNDVFQEYMDSIVSSDTPDPKKNQMCDPYRITYYTKLKPYLHHRVVVELYGVIIDDPVPLSYHRFPHHLRSYSLSDECLHGRWVVWEEARYMLHRDIVETLEPVVESLDRGVIPPAFIPCTIRQ